MPLCHKIILNVMCSLQELQSSLYFENIRGQRDGPAIHASAVKAAEEEVDDENEDDEADDVSLITC